MIFPSTQQHFEISFLIWGCQPPGSGLSVVCPLLPWEEGCPTKSGEDKSLRRAILIVFLHCFPFAHQQAEQAWIISDVPGIARAGEP